MKDKTYENEFGVAEESILTTNSAEMDEGQEKQVKVKRTPKQVWKSVAPILLAVVIVLAVMIGGGVISEHQHQAELARECRDDFQIRYNAAPEVVDGEVTSGVTEIYYSQENGLWVTMAFANGYDTEATIADVEMILKTEEGKRIASAKTKLKNVVVPAGEVKEHKLYLEPHLVEINDDTLEQFTCELTVTDERDTEDK